MKSRVLIRACIILTTFIPFFAAATIAGGAGVSSEEFSADMVSRAGDEAVSAKFYFAGNKMRTEMQGNIVITRLDRNVAIVIMPSEKMYMEQPINPEMLPKVTKDVQGEIERVPLGSEAVNGVQADKFRIVYMGGAGKEEAYQWVADFGFPVKMEAIDGSWGIEYKNISVAPQPGSLFEPPQGFQKVSMPFGVGSGGSSLEDIMAQAGAQE